MSMIGSRRARNRSFCPLSRRSFGRIANLQIASFAKDNHDRAAVSICKLSAAPKPKTGKIEYLQTLTKPSKITALKLFPDDLSRRFQTHTDIDMGKALLSRGNLECLQLLRWTSWWS